MSTSSPRRSSAAARRSCYRYGSACRAAGVAAGDDPLSRPRTAARHAQLHDLAHAPRADRPRGGRPLDRVRDDGQAGRGAAAKLPPDQGDRSCRPSCRSPSSRPTARTTRSSPTTRARSPTSTRSSFRAATIASIIPSRSTAATRRPTGARCTALTELPNVVNPPNGWVQNTNAWPYRAAGAYSPDPTHFPKYMDMDGENFRGLHAHASC